MQFYHSDEQLFSLLTRYVGTALVGGDVAMVVATRSHRQGLERRLASRGLDVAVARRQKRYLAFDARTMVEKFAPAGHVDAETARRDVGKLLERACGPRGGGEPARVFVFGEMVMLIAQQYGPEEAIKLEQVWNDLAAQYEFTLCCGYPMGTFSPRQAGPFVRICGLHSHVFHAADRRV